MWIRVSEKTKVNLSRIGSINKYYDEIWFFFGDTDGEVMSPRTEAFSVSRKSDLTEQQVLQVLDFADNRLASAICTVIPYLDLYGESLGFIKKILGEACEE